MSEKLSVSSMIIARIGLVAIFMAVGGTIASIATTPHEEKKVTKPAPPPSPKPGEKFSV